MDRPQSDRLMPVTILLYVPLGRVELCGFDIFGILIARRYGLLQEKKKKNVQ